MSYNPDQPRVPRGKSTGGQWTKADKAQRLARIGSGLEPDWDNPSQDLLVRARAVFREFTDGDVSKYIYKQMHGANVRDGRAYELTPGQKVNNLRKIRDGLAEIREKDPEAYDWAIQITLADALKTTWAELPEYIDVYRGDAPGARLPPMTNVSLFRDVAASFGEVKHYKIYHWDIGYVNYASSFAEGEAFIFDTKNLIEVIP